MKKMKKKIDERRAKYSFAKGGEIKFGKWTLFRFVRSESRLVATRFNCVNLRHSRKRDVEHSVFGCFEYRTISLSNERKKKRQRERERERKKIEGKNLRITAKARRLDAVFTTLFMVSEEKRALYSREEKERSEIGARSNDEQQANSLEEKEEEGRTGAALNVERHPFSSVASKRLTVPDCRLSRTVHDRSSKSNSVYTIRRSRVQHGAERARHSAPSLTLLSTHSIPHRSIRLRSILFDSRLPSLSMFPDAPHKARTRVPRFTLPDTVDKTWGE